MRFVRIIWGIFFKLSTYFPYLTVKENIQLSWIFQGRQSKVEDVDDEISRLCEKLGLSAFQYSRIDQLSIGQQQRAAAARAFLGHPELILADEPTSSLDYDHRENSFNWCFEVCEKKGQVYFFVSHDRSLEKLLIVPYLWQKSIRRYYESLLIGLEIFYGIVEQPVFNGGEALRSVPCCC